MTINTHSYIETDSEKKLNIFVDAINRLSPDIVAMQEVNQISKNREVSSPYLVFQQGIPLKDKNYCLCTANALAKLNNPYYFMWVGIKKSYDIFDEGLCFMTKVRPSNPETFVISHTENPDNWKKRAILGMELNNERFYNLHMGRWDDEEEPFMFQWNKFSKTIPNICPIWIMGDFNSPHYKKNEGYEKITADGWYDTYELAERKDDGFTVYGNIDGWANSALQKSRIDYIFTNKKRNIKYSFTVFNGNNEEIISDHFGIITEY